MKTIRSRSILILPFLWATSCVTTNVNQPPHVVEKTTPGFRDREDRVSARSTPEEDDYFSEASKQDPAMKGSTRNPPPDAEKPENSAPGYGKGQEGTEERTTADQKDPDPVAQKSDRKEGGLIPVAATGDLSDYSETGLASWYGRDFDGRPTSSGEPFDSRKLTAAHRTLPLGTVILVRNEDNKKEVILKVNDRGPYVKGRILDVSEYGSEVLAFKERGLARVSIKVIKKGDVTERGDGATALFFRRPETGEGGAELEQKSEDRPKPSADQMDKMRKEVKPSDDLSRFAVQIGLFSDLENAVRLKTYLSDRYGQPVSIYQRGTEYVVKIGSFADRYSAEKLKSKVEGDGYHGFITGKPANR